MDLGSTSVSVVDVHRVAPIDHSFSSGARSLARMVRLPEALIGLLARNNMTFVRFDLALPLINVQVSSREIIACSARRAREHFRACTSQTVPLAFFSSCTQHHDLFEI